MHLLHVVRLVEMLASQAAVLQRPVAMLAETDAGMAVSLLAVHRHQCVAMLVVLPVVADVSLAAVLQLVVDSELDVAMVVAKDAEAAVVVASKCQNSRCQSSSCLS